jgi:hypothetical protein
VWYSAMALPLSKIASIEHLLTAPRSPTTTGKICENLDPMLYRPGLTPAKV